MRAVVWLDDIVDLTGREDPDDLRTVDFSITPGGAMVAVFPCGGQWSPGGGGLAN